MQAHGTLTQLANERYRLCSATGHDHSFIGSSVNAHTYTNGNLTDDESSPSNSVAQSRSQSQSQHTGRDSRGFEHDHGSLLSGD